MFHCTIGSQNYAEIYEICFGFAVNPHSELPHRVCNDCENNLISHFNFRTSIEAVEAKIKTYYESQFEQKPSDDDLMYDSLHVPEDEQVDGQFLEEALEVEQQPNDSNDLSDEEEYFEFVVQEPESTCRFKPTQNGQRQVKCVVCTAECDIEILVNKSRPEEQISIQCCECANVYKNRRSFLKHFAIIHEKRESSFNCRKCDERFSSWRGRIAHEAKTHGVGLNHECSSCKKKFFRSDHWKEHERICSKTLSDSSIFSCSICMFTFQREDTFRKHLETAHPGASEGDDEYVRRAENYAQRYSSRKTRAEAGQLVDKRTTCSVCKRVFKSLLSMNKHFTLFHTNHSWSCKECGETFLHRSTKVSHMSKVHGVKKPFECSESDCSFSCFKKDRFIAHQEKHKNPDKKFPCPICQQEFKSYNTMTVHRARHLTKNALQCPTCGRQFLDKRNYNTHLKIHTQEDLFNCKVCSRGFTRKDHLTKHFQRHHESMKQNIDK